jgi:hypothetical protein
MMPKRESEGWQVLSAYTGGMAVMKRIQKKQLAFFSPEVQGIIKEIQTLLNN